MFFIAVIVTGLLQATVLTDVHLLAALAAFSGLRRGSFAGLLIGGAIGIFAGILSSSFGLNVAVYGMVGFVSGAVRGHIYYRENLFMQVAFSFLGVVLFYFAYFIFTGIIAGSVFSTALLSAAVSPIIFRIVKL